MSKQLLRSTSVVGCMTLISRVLGFVRDMVAALIFGAGPAYDAFILAFKIPNFLRRLFAEGAFSQAFVPVLAEYRATQGEEGARIFLNKICGSLMLVLGVVTILGILFAPGFILAFAPGFKADDSRFVLASDMLRITFPYLFFISLTAFAGGILNTYGRFASAAFTPTLLNVSMILSTFLLTSFFATPIVALAWGVCLGGVLQFGFQLPFLKRQHLLPHPVLDWQDSGVKKVLMLMAPALLGVSVNQINLVVDTMFASFLPAGSVSWLYYADRLMEFPLGVFGVALVTVILPHLSSKHAERSQTEFQAALDFALRWVILIGVPSAIGLSILAAPLMITLFQYGKFTEGDAHYSAQCLVVYGFGVFSFMAAKIFASAFYARQEIKIPVYYAIWIMLVNAVLNSIFIGPLQHVGLALATTIASYLNVFLLFMGLRRRGVLKFQPDFSLFITKCALANAGMIIVLLQWIGDESLWLSLPFTMRVLRLGILVTASGLLYFAVLWSMGLRPRHMMLIEKTQGI